MKLGRIYWKTDNFRKIFAIHQLVVAGEVISVDVELRLKREIVIAYLIVLMTSYP